MRTKLLTFLIGLLLSGVASAVTPKGEVFATLVTQRGARPKVTDKTLTLRFKSDIDADTVYVRVGNDTVPAEMLAMPKKNTIYTFTKKNLPVPSLPVTIWSSGHIWFLNMDSNDVTAFDIQGGASTVREFRCANDTIADMDFVRKMTALEYFQTDKNPAVESLVFTTPNLTRLVLGELRGLKSLTMSGDKIYELSLKNSLVQGIDLGNCPAMKTLSLLGNSLLGNVNLGPGQAYTRIDIGTAGELSSIDFKDLPLLATLNVYNCPKLTSISFSNLPKLATLDIRQNAFTSLSIPDLPALKTLTLTADSITDLDLQCLALTRLTYDRCPMDTLVLPSLPALTTLTARDGDVRKIVISDASLASITSLSLTNNRLGIAGIPKRPAKVSESTNYYAPQKQPQIPANVAVGAKVDLSHYLKNPFVAGESVYEWRDRKENLLVAGTDYDENAGIFTFRRDMADSVRCYITNESWPSFSRWTDPKGNVTDNRIISNFIAVGNGIAPEHPDTVYEAPFFEDFETEDGARKFSTIDANGDNRTWQYSSSAKAMMIMWNSEVAMDDWLLLPIRLEKGKTYEFTMDYRGASDRTEAIEVKLGTDTVASTFTTSVVPGTQFNSKTYTGAKGYITVPTDGKYYVGIHGISPANGSFLYVDNIRISQSMDLEAPAAPTSLKLEAAADGTVKAIISGKAPRYTMSNKALTAIDKLEILRADTVVGTLTGIQPGASFEYTDSTLPGLYKSYTYGVRAYNQYGAGRTATVTAYLGIGKPMPVTDLQLKEISRGKVLVTWTPPVVDVNGDTIPEGKVTYAVFDGSTPATSIVKRYITEPRFEWTVMTEGQKFIYVVVMAETAAGFSKTTISGSIPVGFPYALPLQESFADQKSATAYGIRQWGNSKMTWRMFPDGLSEGVNSYDHDNGFLASNSTMPDDTGMFFTGKFDLTDAVRPQLTFYTYVLKSDTEPTDRNEIEIQIREEGPDKDFVVLHPAKTIAVLCGTDSSVWRPVRFDLSAYNGKIVQVGIRVKVVSFVYTMIDRLSFSEASAADMCAERLEGPLRNTVNKTFNTRLLVTNRGTAPIAADAYTIRLYRDSMPEPITVINGKALGELESAWIDVPARLGLDCDSSSVFHAEIVLDGDGNQADNVSNSVEVAKIIPFKAAPTNLVAKASGSAASLTWNAPDLSGNQPVTDDFESYDSFALSGVGEWSFIDEDDSPVGGFSGHPLPGITSGVTRMAYTVFDNTDKYSFNTSFAASSGNKFLASLYRRDFGAVSDWVITPRLSGDAQQIRFAARSYSPTAPESYEVYYSTKTAAKEDFVKLADNKRIPVDWIEYKYDLPAGARYAGVRCVSTNGFLFQIDDFTFIPAKPELLGYNIYRDNVRLNETPVGSLSYLDAQAPKSATYYVTAVYAAEESGPSNRADYYNGVGLVTTGLSVGTEGSDIIVSGADGQVILIADMAGRVCTRRTGLTDLRYSAAPGIYMVRVGSASFKVLVK